MLATYSESISRHLSHARLRHLGACGRISRMLKTKRVALSVRVSEHARDALYRKAEREGHRYPAAFAAVLLERAVEAAPSEATRPVWMFDIYALARVFGGSVTVEPKDATGRQKVTLTLESGSKEPALVWLQSRVMANHPPPEGLVFMVKVAP